MSTTPTGAEAASAIVTGAGSGIGRAVTLALAAAGDRVLAVDRNLESAEETAKLASGTVVAHRSDVSDPDQVAGYLAAALEQHGPPRSSSTTPGSRVCTGRSRRRRSRTGSRSPPSTCTACSTDSSTCCP